jgi:hypothetical protein
VNDSAAAVRREAGELGHGTANLLALLGGEPLHGFGAGHNALPLLGRHVIQLGKAVAHPLLDLRGKVVKAGFALECSLLIGQGEVAVAIHPLGEVFLVSLRAEGRVRGRGRTTPEAGLGHREGSQSQRKESTGAGALQMPGCEEVQHGISEGLQSIFVFGEDRAFLMRVSRLILLVGVFPIKSCCFSEQRPA